MQHTEENIEYKYVKGVNTMLKVHEIFSSIQGETTGAGFPCTFVRLFGCALNCAYCDQPQDKKDLKRMSPEHIVSEVRKLKVRNVCITGGEPLQQEEIFSVVYELLSLGYEVSIETNGAMKIDEDNYNRKFKYVMDVKCPSSKMEKRNVFSNLEILHACDEVKFVIADRKDYDFMKKVLRKHKTKAKVLLSPMFSTDETNNHTQTIGRDLVNWLIEDSKVVAELKGARIQIQLHKVLGVQ